MKRTLVRQGRPVEVRPSEYEAECIAVIVDAIQSAHLMCDRAWLDNDGIVHVNVWATTGDAHYLPMSVEGVLEEADFVHGFFAGVSASIQNHFLSGSVPND